MAEAGKEGGGREAGTYISGLEHSSLMQGTTAWWKGFEEHMQAKSFLPQSLTLALSLMHFLAHLGGLLSLRCSMAPAATAVAKMATRTVVNFILAVGEAGGVGVIKSVFERVEERVSE